MQLSDDDVVLILKSRETCDRVYELPGLISRSGRRTTIEERRFDPSAVASSGHQPLTRSSLALDHLPSTDEADEAEDGGSCGNR